MTKNSNDNNNSGRAIMLYQSLTPTQYAALECSGWRGFSAGVSEQKIFYPKLRLAYAETIARMFNVKHYSAAYVVRFRLPLSFLQHYPVQSIAYEDHREYSIPVADLEKMNRHILGRIEVVSTFWGDNKPKAHNLFDALEYVS